jgi:lipopolysaccharide biosynthesis protein
MTKRITIFAHFDKDNVIDDYVIFYLKELKKISEKIIFVSACDLATVEKNKLDGICEVVIAQNHKEYDFGSYKRGFHYFIENSFDCDEIIFANDSCYGPLYPLKEVFDKMDKETLRLLGNK